MAGCFVIPNLAIKNKNKMAAVRFVVSHPLCFLLDKFGKTQSKLLKSTLVDFYSSEDLSSAKKQLQKDTGEIQSVSCSTRTAATAG